MKRRKFFKGIAIAAVSAPVILKEISKPPKEYWQPYIKNKWDAEQSYINWNLSPKRIGGKIKVSKELYNDSIYNHL